MDASGIVLRYHDIKYVQDKYMQGKGEDTAHSLHVCERSYEHVEHRAPFAVCKYMYS